MWRMAAVLIGILAIAIFGFTLIDAGGSDNVGASTFIDASEAETDGFARAVAPYDWSFPADFGAHPEFQTEWWYYTGNLANATGERFGFQFTIFRRAIQPEALESESEWRDNQIYMAHFTVSDIARERYFHEQRFSRASADLAGVTADPRYRVWLEDWEILAQNDAASLVQIQAESDNFAIDLLLEQLKEPALQGDNGLSQKSDEVGNASYYYTLSRLQTDGTITIDGEVYEVSGLTWKDHEFSTSALGENAQGWDWFGLIFDDNREMMIGQIRLTDEGKDPNFGGLMIYPDGSTEYLDANAFTITETATWTSPNSDATYPAGWTMNVQLAEETLNFTVSPLMNAQELYDTDPAYWEGAVRVEGDVTGYGYAELTGYVQTMQGRF